MYGLEFKRMSWRSFSMRGGRQCSFWAWHREGNFHTEFGIKCRPVLRPGQTGSLDQRCPSGVSGLWSSYLELFSFLPWYWRVRVGRAIQMGLLDPVPGPVVLIPPFRASSHSLPFFGVDQMPQETWASCLWCYPGTRDLLGVGCLERG